MAWRGIAGRPRPGVWLQSGRRLPTDATLGYEQIQQLIRRIEGHLHDQPWVVAVELAVIWLAVFLALRFLHGTRGARVIKGAALVLIVGTLLMQVLAGRDSDFERLSFLYDKFLTFAALALIVVFQPELRRGLVRLGEARLFRGGGRMGRVIDQIVGSVAYLSRNKIGGLIAIERQVGLKGIVEAGTAIDAVVSRDLLNTIFWPGSALHDMGVVIRDDRVAAAGVQFPLAEGVELDSELGSRHRAAIGLSQECDALVIVVSEETGKISIAQRGVLTRGLSPQALRERLLRGLSRRAERRGSADMNPDENAMADDTPTDPTPTGPRGGAA